MVRITLPISGKETAMSGKTRSKAAGLRLSLAVLFTSLLITGGCAKKPTADEIVAQMQEVVMGTSDSELDAF